MFLAKHHFGRTTRVVRRNRGAAAGRPCAELAFWVAKNERWDPGGLRLAR